MNKKTKHWLLTALAASTLCASALGVACNKEKGPGPQFLKGIQTDIELGDSIVMEHFIQYVTDSEYSIIITGPNGYEYDATKKTYWAPDDPGKYTFTYTVEEGEFAGTNSFVMEVTVPKLSIEYTMQNVVYDTGDVFVFSDYFFEMNIAAKSFYPWQMVMDSVTVDGETTTFARTDTSYTFVHSGPHVFESHAETEDGQTITLKQSINVRHVEPETLAWMKENDIDAHNALRLDLNNKIVLDESIYSYKDNPSIPSGGGSGQHMASYVAFNGDYSFNDFVVFDFTGNNMPIISFFNEEVNDNPFYQAGASDALNKGLLLYNGWTTGMGKPVAAWELSINNRFCVSGPNKARNVDYDLDGWFRKSFGNGDAISMTTLTKEEYIDCSYRMAVGVTAGTASSVTIAVYCVNLTTGKVMYNRSQTFEMTETSTHKDPLFPGDYFSGSIVLYGMYGKETTIDQIYAIEENVTMNDIIEKHMQVSAFKDDAEKDVYTKVALKVSDYVQITSEQYTFSYTDAQGNETLITDDTFTFTAPGNYTLHFKDGEKSAVSLQLVVSAYPSDFKPFVPTSALVNAVLNVDDYIVKLDGVAYTLRYIDPMGNEVRVTGDTFSFTTAGVYTLYYCDGVNSEAVMTITAENIEIDASTTAFVEENNMSLYRVESALDNKFVLKASTHDGTDDRIGYGMGVTSNMSYIAFNGNYGFNDYLVFDFTGNNMPFISFFNNQVTPTVFNNTLDMTQKGVLIGAGLYNLKGQIYNEGGALSTRLTVFGPNKCTWYDDTKPGQFRSDLDGNSPLALLYLKDFKSSYRVIVGFSGNSDATKATSLTARMLVLDLNTGVIVRNYSKTITSPKEFDAFGSIALHGQFAKTTTLDKIYAIEENKTFEDVVAKYADMSAFNANAKTEVYTDTALNVSDYIQPKNAQYTFSYIDAQGNETPITGDTFSFATAGTYKLRFVDGDKNPATLTMEVSLRPSEFKPFVETTVQVGDILNVDDYVVKVSGATHTFRYTDEQGNETQITGDTFSFAATGTYTLLYTDGVNAEVSKTITVLPASSKFKKTASASVATNQILNVSDYIVTVDGAQYTLTYTDKDGVTLPITGNTFTFATAGVYTLNYNDGVNLDATFRLSVAELSAAAATWIANNNVTFHNMQSMDDNQKVVLGASTVEGSTNPNAANTTRDMSYLAFNGTYGAGDFLAIEFTGNNMPYITLAAGSVTNDAWNVSYDGSTRSVADLTDTGKGIVLLNGYTKTDGSICSCGVEKRMNFVGPFKMQSAEGDVANQPIRQGCTANAGIGVYELQNSTDTFCLVVGIKSATQTSVSFSIMVYNLTQKKQVYYTDGGLSFNVSAADLSRVEGNLFEGSIVLHGQFGKQTTIDKVYSIYENKNFGDVAWNLKSR